MTENVDIQDASFIVCLSPVAVAGCPGGRRLHM
jgi:hypothetical protein